MLSIPRDLWVPIPGQGTRKISRAYRLGAAPGAVAAAKRRNKPFIRGS